MRSPTKSEKNSQQHINPFIVGFKTNLPAKRPFHDVSRPPQVQYIIYSGQFFGASRTRHICILHSESICIPKNCRNKAVYAYIRRKRTTGMWSDHWSIILQQSTRDGPGSYRHQMSKRLNRPWFSTSTNDLYLQVRVTCSNYFAFNSQWCHYQLVRSRLIRT